MPDGFVATLNISQGGMVSALELRGMMTQSYLFISAGPFGASHETHLNETQFIPDFNLKQGGKGRSCDTVHGDQSSFFGLGTACHRVKPV
jgi:hypothetical protein